MEVIDVMKQIKSRQLYNLYIFTGEEIGIQDVYINKIAETVDIPLLRKESVTDIISSLVNGGFITKNHCYVIRNDMTFFKAEKEWKKVETYIGNNILILIYDNIDKRSKFYKHYESRIINFEHLGEDVLIKYINKEIPLSFQNVRELIKLCENDYSRILLEIDKIRQYMTANNCLADDAYKKLVDSGLIYKSPGDVIFQFVDSLCAGLIQKTFQLAKECIASGENPLIFLTVVYNNIKQLLQVQSCRSDDICKVTGLTPWQVKNAKQRMGAYTDNELVKALKLIQETERKLKTGEIDQEMVIEYVTVRILQ